MPDRSTDVDIDQIKRDLRARCIKARNALVPEQRRAAAAAIASIGLEFAQAGRGAIVSSFSRMGAEIDPALLVRRLFDEGYRICLPVVQPRGNPLVFRAWAPGDHLVPRVWGILEPVDTAPIVEPDLLLVPLLAFDAAGRRLGYGAGYYDRTIERLRRLKPVLAIGLAYDSQELAEVPTTPRDQVLDWVLTPSGARRATTPPSATAADGTE
jgi:5-formyltetrahydrofolate cyclo-ligase